MIGVERTRGEHARQEHPSFHRPDAAAIYYASTWRPSGLAPRHYHYRVGNRISNVESTN